MGTQKKRIYVDTEYVFPNMGRDYGMPTEDDQRQIVQIAAILVDQETGEELESFDQIVFPKYMKKIPIFFTELTKITQDDVNQNAISFIKALKQFVEFCRDYPVWTFNADYGVFKQNCTFFNIDMPFKKDFIRVKPLLSSWGIDPNKYSSGTLYKVTKQKMQGHVHNALHDVRSMAMSVHYLESK